MNERIVNNPMNGVSSMDCEDGIMTEPYSWSEKNRNICKLK